MFAVQSHLGQQLVDPIGPILPAVGQFVNVNGFAYDLAYGHARVERSGRILKDNLHFATIREHPDVGDIFPVIIYLSGSGLMETENGSAKGCFPATRFSHKSQGFAFLYAKVGVFHRLDIVVLHEAHFYTEIFSKVFNPYQIIIIHWEFPPS